MKNHFFFPYVGNKREEVEHILDKLDLSNITTIVEPFCGSCALSYYISTKYPNKFKYILNDKNKNLMDLLKITNDKKQMEMIEKELEEVKKDIDKPKYLEYIKKKQLSSYIFGNKYYAIRANTYPIMKMQVFNKVFKFNEYPIYDFLQNEDVEIYDEDAINIIEKYNDENTIIFLDPPYLNSCNMMYNEYSSNIYEYLLLNKLDSFKSNVFICHENSWLFKLMFKDYINDEDEYDKRYKMNEKKKTKHIIINNRKKN